VKSLQTGYKGADRIRDTAWAAGLFEGEGCVYAKPDKGRVRIAVSLDSCDEDVLRRFADVVGVGRVYGPYNHSRGTKPYWKWKATGPENVRQVYRLVGPELGERRRAAFSTAFRTHRLQPAPRRRGGDSNPGDGLCRPAPNHSATTPGIQTLFTT
jgi:hypothetical protein